MRTGMVAFARHFLGRYLSNQSASFSMSLARSTQPCAAPFLTTTSAGTFNSFSLATIALACWIGTRH